MVVLVELDQQTRWHDGIRNHLLLNWSRPIVFMKTFHQTIDTKKWDQQKKKFHGLWFMLFKSRQLSVVRRQRSVASWYRVSVSTINYQLSTINYQLLT